MISRYKYKDISWVDIQNPTKDEVIHLMDNYDLPPLVAEEILTKTIRSKADVYEKVGIMYLVLHFPVWNPSRMVYEDKEIDFVLGKKFILTTHYELVDPLHEFSKLFEVNSMLDKGHMGDHAGFLFLYMIRELYKFSARELDYINDQLVGIEEMIFEGKETETVEIISTTNRHILSFRQAIRFHASILNSFEHSCAFLYEDRFKLHIPTLHNERNKVQSMLDNHREMLKDLRDTNDSILATKTNEVMKFLTIITFVMLPITLISGIFGMNTSFNLLPTVLHFYALLGVTFVTGLVMIAFFRSKKWL